MSTRTVQLIATLTDSDGNPLSNKVIYFYYREHGASNWTELGTALTDQYGKAILEKDVEAPKTYDFKAEFKGDSDYEPSSAEVDNVHVKAKTVLKLEVTVVS